MQFLTVKNATMTQVKYRNVTAVLMAFTMNITLLVFNAVQLSLIVKVVSSTFFSECPVILVPVDID